MNIPNEYDLAEVLRNYENPRKAFRVLGKYSKVLLENHISHKAIGSILHCTTAEALEVKLRRILAEEIARAQGIPQDTSE